MDFNDILQVAQLEKTEPDYPLEWNHWHSQAVEQVRVLTIAKQDIEKIESLHQKLNLDLSKHIQVRIDWERREFFKRCILQVNKIFETDFLKSFLYYDNSIKENKEFDLITNEFWVAKDTPQAIWNAIIRQFGDLKAHKQSKLDAVIIEFLNSQTVQRNKNIISLNKYNVENNFRNVPVIRNWGGDDFKNLEGFLAISNGHEFFNNRSLTYQPSDNEQGVGLQPFYFGQLYKVPNHKQIEYLKFFKNGKLEIRFFNEQLAVAFFDKYCKS